MCDSVSPHLVATRSAKRCLDFGETPAPKAATLEPLEEDSYDKSVVPGSETRVPAQLSFFAKSGPRSEARNILVFVQNSKLWNCPVFFLHYRRDWFAEMFEKLWNSPVTESGYLLATEYKTMTGAHVSEEHKNWKRICVLLYGIPVEHRQDNPPLGSLMRIQREERKQFIKKHMALGKYDDDGQMVSLWKLPKENIRLCLSEGHHWIGTTRILRALPMTDV